MREIAIGFVAGWVVSRFFYQWLRQCEIREAHRLGRLWQRQQELYRYKEKM